MDKQNTSDFDERYDSWIKVAIPDDSAQTLLEKKEFILSHFSYKECIKFVANPSSALGQRCFCGEFIDNHIRYDGNVPEDNEKWSENTHIMSFRPTNAFGQIQFLTEISTWQNPAEFVRISDEDSLQDVMTLMTYYWHMMKPVKPCLCISVIGGAKNFSLQGHKKEVFNTGLIQAARTTNAWIVTSALNLGIIRVVGDAVRESQTFCPYDRKIPQPLRCLGIAPWGYVADREFLIGSDEEEPLQYYSSPVVETGRPVSLNPDHTHFIFVDEGRRLRYGGSASAQFRARLEKQIALPIKKGGWGIPVVLVVVEGGYDVFIDARNSIRERVPIVICGGTGRAADILETAYEYRSKCPDANFVSFHTDELINLKRKLIPVSGANKVDKALEMIKEIVRDRNLITIFDMKRADEDLDMAILYALVKTSSSITAQLHLALAWNRSDIAEQRILTSGVRVNPANLEPIMMRALLENKPEFVRILLKCDVVMRHFLTFERLHQLYNNSHRRTGFLRCLHNHGLLNPTLSEKKSGIKPQKMVKLGTMPFPSNAMGRRIYLSTVNRLMRKILRRFINREYDQDNLAMRNESEEWEKIRRTKFERPFQDLFLWAILHQRQEMALLFWEHCEESIALALIACCLYTNMMKFIPDYDTETQMCYAHYVDTFEKLAVSLLEECDETDPDKTDLLIMRQRPIWGGFSFLQLAFQSNRRKFISSRACQNSIHFAWCHGMRADKIVILVTLIFPFLLYSDKLIKWGDDQILSEELKDIYLSSSDFQENNSAFLSDNLQTLSELPTYESPLPFSEKLHRFYSAPQNKFYLSSVAYIFFLIYFSYTLLFTILPNRISVCEAVLMTYFIAMTIDIIWQISLSPTKLCHKFSYWWKTYTWNRAEFFILLFAYISMLLRIGLQNTFIEAKTFYVITLISAYIRVLGLYSCHANLGPKLVMIQNMMKELMLFIFIILIVLVPFGVASQTLLFPYRTIFEWKTIRDVFYYPYWNLFGELGLDFAMAESPTCRNGTVGVDCPEFNFTIPLLLAIYLMIGSGLLMNLLIAIYSNVFEQIEEQSIELWKFSMYTMVVEYDKRPILPVPLSVLEAFVELIKCLIQKCFCTEGDTEFGKAARRGADVLISIVKSPHSQTENEDDENYRDFGTNLFEFSNRNPNSDKNEKSERFEDGLKNDQESSKRNPKDQYKKFLDFFNNLDLSEVQHDAKTDLSARQFELNCKRTVFKKKKLEKEKTAEASLHVLEQKVDKIFRCITDISDRIEMQTREKEDQAVEIIDKVVQPGGIKSLISLSAEDESPQPTKKISLSINPILTPIEKPDPHDFLETSTSGQINLPPNEPLPEDLEQTLHSTASVLLRNEDIDRYIEKPTK